MSDNLSPTDATGGQPASKPATQPVSEARIINILDHVWRRYNSYDMQSKLLKVRYRQTRRFIIIISWVTTLLAVLSGLELIGSYLQAAMLLLGLAAFGLMLRYFRTSEEEEQNRRTANQRPSTADTPTAQVIEGPSPDPSPARGRWFLLRLNLRSLFFFTAGCVFIAVGQIVRPIDTSAEDQAILTSIHSFLTVTLVALPLLSAGLLAFASRFEKGAAWVAYRVSAETIRRGIYMLRVRWGITGKVQAQELKKLLDLVEQIDAEIEPIQNTTPTLLTTFRRDEHNRTRPNWLDAPGKDNGYQPLQIQQYIDWRVEPQTTWYRQQVRTDYQKTYHNRALILLIGGMGAFLAAVELGAWVAVSVAGTTALVAWLGLMQYETTYPIFMRTIVRLEFVMGQFFLDFDPQNLPINPNKAEQDKIFKFVEGVEAAFDEERALWRLSILQTQETTEEKIAHMVSRHAAEFDFKSLLGMQKDDKEADQEADEETESATEETPAQPPQTPGATGDGAPPDNSAVNDPVGEPVGEPVAEPVAEPVHDPGTN